MPLIPPPRNVNGAVLPHDHPGISNDDGVIRRVSPQFAVKDAKAQGGSRLSTLAFDPSSPANGGGLSIDLEREIIEAGGDVIAHLLTPPWLGAVRFQAGAVRGLGLHVGFDPIAATAINPAGNPFHGDIWGIAGKAHQRHLMRIANRLIAIPNCALHAA